jgi:hypothetical protein
MSSFCLAALFLGAIQTDPEEIRRGLQEEIQRAKARLERLDAAVAPSKEARGPPKRSAGGRKRPGRTEAGSRSPIITLEIPSPPSRPSRAMRRIPSKRPRSR